MKDKLERFNTGGLHSENPNGGIPLNGNNTVEEGETKYNNFVFSNRLKIDKDLIDEFKLPGYIKDKSYADASKLIDNKFKDRNDNASNETKKTLFDRLSKAHEYVKMQESLKLNSTDTSDLPELAPEGFGNNQMFLGGYTDLLNGLQNTGQMGQHAGLNQLSTGLDLANTAFGDTGIDTSGKMTPPNINTFSNTLSTISKGAGAGAMFGPVGAGIGALVGGAAGFLGSRKAKKDIEEATRNNAIINSSRFSNDFALGGPLDPITDTEAFKNLKLNTDLTSQYALNQFKLPTANIPLTTQDTTIPNNNILPKANLGKAVDWLSDNLGNVLRYAPVATNVMQLANLRGPEQERLNRLDSRFRPEYVDERSIQNIVGNEYDNTVNALTNTTNGSVGALRSNILGAGINRTKAMSDAYLKASDANRNMNITGQQFNLGIDQANLSQDNLERDINARNRAAYDNNKSKLIAQLGNDIGNIGKEEVFKRIAKTAFGYNWLGEYVKNNPNASKEDILGAYSLQIGNTTPQKQNMFGGYLYKK